MLGKVANGVSLYWQSSSKKRLSAISVAWARRLFQGVGCVRLTQILHVLGWRAWPVMADAAWSTGMTSGVMWAMEAG